MKSQDRNLYPKVLIAVPIYEGKDYIFDTFYKNLMQFTYPNADFIIIDNSKDMHYFLKLKRRGYKCLTHVPRGDNSRQALCNAQNYARTKVLDEGYDYLLFVESDLLPPPDTIQQLMIHNKPVVGVFYLLGTVKKVPCIFIKEYKSEALGMGTRLLNPEEYQEYYMNGLKQVHGTGLGTTLIRRDILQRFYFWHDERFDNKHSDVYFYMDLDNNGIPVYVDTDIIVEHRPSKWEDVIDK
jgi:cellulose synthase/poly-beta-1,6-N-acetylglucosamine synthase-like glycosyltransferase